MIVICYLFLIVSKERTLIVSVLTAGEKGTISITNDDEIGLVHDKKWQINRIQR